MKTLTTNNRIEKAYIIHINYIMETTGLGIMEMQTIEEWVSNRFKDYENDKSYSAKLNGFEWWLENR